MLVGLLVLLTPVYGLVGYDCAGPALNITTYSLLEIGECKIKETEPIISKVRIQLLQLIRHKESEIVQCKTEIDRTITYCGMHSHTSNVANGKRQYILEMDYQQCKRLIESNSIVLNNFVTIDNLKPNTTNHNSVTLAGHLGVDGSCKGTKYADQFGTWENVIVEASVKITYHHYTTRVNLKTNKILLKTGGECALSEEYCMENGYYSFWRNLPSDDCNFIEYNSLYTGIATKFEANSHTNEIYSVSTNDITFALSIT